jgi:hypothetical protein
MRKKMLFLALALTALAALPMRHAEAAGSTFCPHCTTYPDGSQCCVSCWCNAQGIPIACTDHYCPPAGGID